MVAVVLQCGRTNMAFCFCPYFRSVVVIHSYFIYIPQGSVEITVTEITEIRVELGGRVVRVLDSGQHHQSERSWVRFLVGPLKIARRSFTPGT